MLKIIKELIKNNPLGSISYSDYMSTVLYHPLEGYYMKPGEKVGIDGDFYTSSSVGSIFGKLFSRYFFELITTNNLPAVLCEFGSGNGRFAKAVLEEWKQLTTKELTYYSVEGSPYHQEIQKKVFKDEPTFFLFSNEEEVMEHITSYQGIIFSNEFFDAFPVDIVERKNGILYERRVSIDSEELIEILEPCNDSTIISWLERNDFEIKEGQRLEIPTMMETWINKTAKWFDKGFVITIDYGYFKEEWERPEHKHGSLRGYHRHTQMKNPLQFPGEMDLTTHIHFDSLISVGEKNGLTYVGSERQQEFLIKIGLLDYLQENIDPNPFSPTSRQNRAIRSLIMDGGISSMFHVIIQQKGIKTCNIELV